MLKIIAEHKKYLANAHWWLPTCLQQPLRAETITTETLPSLISLSTVRLLTPIGSVDLLLA